MMRIFRIVLAAAVAALFVAASMTAQVRQARTLSDGVFTIEQAQRGEALSKAQCTECHGDKLQGAVGPMLAGDEFLRAWDGRSLAELVDKIQFTMPVQAPNSLNRQQAIDIAAYLLQASGVRAGQTALADATLKEVAFSTAKPPAATASVALAPAANLAQLMRGVTFPNANIIFNVQVKDPGGPKPAMPVPFDYVLWGMTQYSGWQAVDQAALALVETTPLFMLPGRRCENGWPVPINKVDYQQTTQQLIAVAHEMRRIAQTRNAEALAAASEKLTASCDNCHKVYRDAGTAEGAGVGTDRCKQ